MGAPETISRDRVRLRIGAVIGNHYAYTGDKTYCENGHLLGIFIKDVEVGETDPSAIRPLGEMRIGMIGCPYCDGKSNIDGYYYFAAKVISVAKGASVEVAQNG